MYNLILDFNKLPIFSIRPCVKISYINRPFIKLKIMASVATASSDMPGCKAERLEFLVHWLRFARFYFRTMYLLHLSNRKQSLPEPWRRARVQNQCVKHVWPSIVDELFEIYVKFRKGNDLTEVINGYKRLWV